LTINRLVWLVFGAALAGAVAALAAFLISSATSATVSPLGAGAIGVVFGVTAGNIAAGSRASRRERSVADLALRAIIAGLTAGLTILLIQKP
jgi:hypothetical protein